MNRFRKKSDAKRSQLPSTARNNSPTTRESLPELPPASDFRTSLILPDLSRRFTLLRTSAGEPVTLDDLKSRLAEQRARGTGHQISEGEEDMILETLGRMRARNVGMRESSEASPRQAGHSSGLERHSARSTDTEITEASSTSGSVTSSPSGRIGKRYSNNLFGSGRFRDNSYLRSVASQQSKAGSTRSANSYAPTESSASLRNADIRAGAPDQYPSDAIQPSSENDLDNQLLSANEVVEEDSASSTDHHATMGLSPSALRRASRALERAIKEIEEEGEDEIVMPRTALVPRHNGASEPTHQGVDELRQSVSDSTTHSDVEAGMAISSDHHAEPEVHRVSPVPFRIAPGYIPGMPRPMTPRDNMELDDRSHSTTPRATSPAYAALAEPPSPIFPTNKISNMNRLGRSSPSSPRPTSPLASSAFLARSMNGRHTPESTSRGTDDISIEFDSPINSTVLARRRPASPLSGPAYQPLTVSSRPSTPSNITWTTPQNTGHSRNSSWTSEAGISSDSQQPLDRSTSTTRSLRSPPLPDSPTIEGVGNVEYSNSQSSNGSILPDLHHFSPISRVDSGSQLFPRSPTPTQTPTRSPASQTSLSEAPARNGSRRNSRQQNVQTSPANLAAFPSLAFSPIANSSRSSLASTGSSYHSSDPDNIKHHGLSILSDADPLQPAWHEFPPDSYSTTPGGSPDDDLDMEDVIVHYAGLNRADFMAIQEKLVSAAIAKTAPPETRERVPSLRRRRPSTSQSNYSLNGRIERIASPPPQTQPPPLSSPIVTVNDQAAKVNALLNSVVDSIQAASPSSTSPSIVERTVSTQSDRDISPTTRRNRDLAQVLFGDELDKPDKPILPTPDVTQALPEVSPLQPTNKTIVSLEVEATPPLVSSPITATPLQQLRNPSTPRLPQSPEEAAELHRAVQMQAEAATRALRKPPSSSNLAVEGTPVLSSGTISRKRINPGQIGSPTLVSSTASVDTIPLRPPSSSSGNYGAPSKISQRFRKFRGTLKSKPTPQVGGEITPYPLDPRGAYPTSQAATYDPTKLSPGMAVPSSATDFGRTKVLVPSPPASAGPGIKGFMARFRSKKAMESHQEVGRRPTSQQAPASATTPPSFQTRPATADSAPPLSQTSISPVAFRNETARESSQPDQENPSESVAIKQLFEAADALSVDRQALSALLRSASVSSKATLTRNPSMSRPPPDIPEEQRPTSPLQIVVSGRPSVDSQPPNDDHLFKKGSIRRQVDSLRPLRESIDAPTSSVVRRTIILASDTRSSTIDLNTLLRKGSNRRKRTSAQSFSNRSVHDRVPTPPPPRTSTSRRFSHEPSPPIPHLPGSAPQGDYLSIPSASGTDKPISAAYDSLYDMYAGDRTQSTAGEYDPAQSPRHETPVNPEAGTALEVIELANGETIWSIVNGLRDDDMESVYGRRASFASEYSSRENGDGIQVFFKEHNRSGSKGSTTSFLSRKKSQAKHRPDTKVFYSSPAQIGRLIEDLSQGTDSGSFNIMPTLPLPMKQTGHSTTSSVSEANWTVEERLEHMLGSMGAK